jgi:hypothetical protein
MGTKRPSGMWNRASAKVESGSSASGSLDDSTAMHRSGRFYPIGSRSAVSALGGAKRSAGGSGPETSPHRDHRSPALVHQMSGQRSSGRGTVEGACHPRPKGSRPRGRQGNGPPRVSAAWAACNALLRFTPSQARAGRSPCAALPLRLHPRASPTGRLRSHTQPKQDEGHETDPSGQAAASDTGRTPAWRHRGPRTPGRHLWRRHRLTFPQHTPRTGEIGPDPRRLTGSVPRPGRRTSGSLTCRQPKRAGLRKTGAAGRHQQGRGGERSAAAIAAASLSRRPIWMHYSASRSPACRSTAFAARFKTVERNSMATFRTNGALKLPIAASPGSK